LTLYSGEPLVKSLLHPLDGQEDQAVLERGVWLEDGTRPGPLEDLLFLLSEARPGGHRDLLCLRETEEEFTRVLPVLELGRDSR